MDICLRIVTVKWVGISSGAGTRSIPSQRASSGPQAGTESVIQIERSSNSLSLRLKNNPLVSLVLSGDRHTYTQVYIHMYTQSCTHMYLHTRCPHTHKHMKVFPHYCGRSHVGEKGYFSAQFPVGRALELEQLSVASLLEGRMWKRHQHSERQNQSDSLAALPEISPHHATPPLGSPMSREWDWGERAGFASRKGKDLGYSGTSGMVYLLIAWDLVCTVWLSS